MKQMTPRTDACHEGRRELYLGGTVDYTFAAQLETELNETKAALEREQLRLAACDVIAMADTPESAAKVRTDLPQDFQSAASGVIRRVDECIVLRQMVREVAQAKPDAIVIMCTNLHGANLVDALEQELGIPIYDSVASVAWSALQTLGVSSRQITGWGRLFQNFA